MKKLYRVWRAQDYSVVSQASLIFFHGVVENNGLVQLLYQTRVALSANGCGRAIEIDRHELTPLSY